MKVLRKRSHVDNCLVLRLCEDVSKRGKALVAPRQLLLPCVVVSRAANVATCDSAQ